MEKDENPEIYLGNPIALISAADFFSTSIKTAVNCDCGKPFALDLLNTDIKVCPHCGLRFTHLLVIAPEDDNEIALDMLRNFAAQSQEVYDETKPDEPEETAQKPEGAK